MNSALMLKYKEVQREIENEYIIKGAKALKPNYIAWSEGTIDEMGPEIRLVVGKTIFNISKCTLCQYSIVFKNMLKHPFKERQSNTVFIEDVDELTMSRFVYYLKTGSYKINEHVCLHGLLRLYYVADKYFVEPLLREVTQDIMDRVTAFNAENIKSFAEIHGSFELFTYAWKIQILDLLGMLGNRGN